jgi:hypothetical protein
MAHRKLKVMLVDAETGHDEVCDDSGHGQARAERSMGVRCPCQNRIAIGITANMVDQLKWISIRQGD